MATKGKIYYVDRDFTDLEVAELFGFPSIFILKDNTGKIIKQTAYDVDGEKSVVEFKAAGSIKNYPTLSDFPIPGDIATIYKALDTDELYVWDSETETYILSSIDDVWKMAVDQGIASALTTLSGVLEEMADIQLNKANKDASEMSPADIISWQEALNIHNLQIALDAEIVNRALEDNKKLNKPTAPNNVSTRVVNADNSTSDKGDFQLSEQIEISTSQTAQDAWKGKEIWVTASCTLTIPAPSALSAAWNIDILVFPSVTLTLAITSGGAWLHTTPGTVSDTFFRIARRGNTTTFKTLGL